jgi:hypothetical protein
VDEFVVRVEAARLGLGRFGCQLDALGFEGQGGYAPNVSSATRTAPLACSLSTAVQPSSCDARASAQTDWLGQDAILAKRRASVGCSAITEICSNE